RSPRMRRTTSLLRGRLKAKAICSNPWIPETMESDAKGRIRMVKLVWFITRPETNIAEAERMYQIGHVRRGMRQENLRSFRISRAFQPQPETLQTITGMNLP